MTQELLYSEGDLRFAVATAKTEIERLTAANSALAEEIEDFTKENVVLTAERDALQATLDGAKLFEQSHRHALTVIDRLESERNAYQLAADKMAMEHKVERDGLGAQVDALEKDAARYRKLCEILQMAYDSQSFDSERLTIYCEQLSGWRNERTVEARVTWIDARDADLDLSSAIDAAIKEHGNDQ